MRHNIIQNILMCIIIDLLEIINNREALRIELAYSFINLWHKNGELDCKILENYLTLYEKKAKIRSYQKEVKQ
jgi:hypothetical protein